MKKLLFIVASLVLLATGVNAQGKYMTREGKITFFSDAALEKIQGINNKVSSALDAATGKMEFALLVKSFQFEKALLEEHFNENYMESDKFPKSAFAGQIVDIAKVNFTKDGSYPVVVRGKLNIHGVTKDVEAKGTINIKGAVITAISTFNVAVADYNIAIPSLVSDKVAKIIKIDVNCVYYPMK